MSNVEVKAGQLEDTMIVTVNGKVKYSGPAFEFNGLRWTELAPVSTPDPVRHDGHAQPTAFLHLTHTDIDPHSGKSFGYPVWHARHGQTGVTGLDCPLQLAAKCCREAVRHMERERLCAKYVIDGDGLATGGKACDE